MQQQTETAKKSSRSKQQPETELLLFENYWLYRDYLNDFNENEDKNEINRTRLVYTNYEMCLSMMMIQCNKQHLSNTWSWVHEKVKQHWGWVEKKPYLFKKSL